MIQLSLNPDHLNLQLQSQSDRLQTYQITRAETICHRDLPQLESQREFSIDKISQHASRTFISVSGERDIEDQSAHDLQLLSYDRRGRRREHFSADIMSAEGDVQSAGLIYNQELTMGLWGLSFCSDPTTQCQFRITRPSSRLGSDEREMIVEETVDHTVNQLIAFDDQRLMWKRKIRPAEH